MKKNQGFTLIELVIVVVILGLMAVTALPRFLSAQDNAQEATVDGVAGGFASAVSLVRAKWELDGRPSGNVSSGNPNQTQVTYDNVTVGVDGTNGFPTGNGQATDTRASSTSAQTCLEVFNLVLQSPPSAAVTSAGFKSVTYAVTSNGNNCHYYHTDTVSTAPTDNASPTLTGSHGFTYDVSSGQVSVFAI